MVAPSYFAICKVMVDTERLFVGHGGSLLLAATVTEVVGVGNPSGPGLGLRLPPA